MPRSSPGSSEGAGLAAVAELRARVFSTNACDAIPGCPIKIETFLPRMWSAVAKGFIPQAEGEQLQEGLLRGFKLGVDPSLMAGHRWFQNYPSATTTGRTGVAAPATYGDPTFERYYRVQMNTVEQLVIFLPALALFAHTVNEPVAAGFGLVFILGRALYARGYLRDPAGRGPGFGLTILANAVLLLGGLAGAIVAWL